MKVHLIRSRDADSRELSEVHNFLLSVDGPLAFKMGKSNISFDEDVVSWDSIFSKCIEYRNNNNIPSEDYVVLLMKKPNDRNWFSSYNPIGKKEIFIHTADWDYYVSCKNMVAVAYQIIENILQSLMFDSQEDSYNYCHEDAIGCINDMCFWKPDISFKLRTADICSDCITHLKKKNIEDGLIHQVINIMDEVRKNALFRYDFFRQENSNDLLPFPVAITKRKIETTIDPLRKFLFLLDHFDSLIRISVLLFGAIRFKNKLNNLIKDNALDNKPSLGDWVKALIYIKEHQIEHQSDLFDYDDDLIYRINEVVQASEENNIVNLRNEKRGHGYCNCNDSSYAEVYNRYQPIIQNIENRLYPILIRLRCHYIQSGDRISDNEYKITVRPLIGNHPDFVENHITIQPQSFADIPITDHVYVCFNKAWYDLHPYVIYGDCPLCGHNRVLITDGNLYIDPYVGHRTELPTNCAST